MEIHIKYYRLHFELTTTSYKFVYISILEVIMGGHCKVTSNSIKSWNLIMHHFKDGKIARTIGKLVKVSH